MTFSDKPEPGMHYIALMLLPGIGGVVITGWQLVERDVVERPAEFIMFAIICVVALFITLKTVHDAFNTEYRLEENRLVLRQGQREAQVKPETIESIELKSYFSISAWFNSKGFANQLTDLTIIKTPEAKYVLTPTNPQLFISHIREKLSRGPTYNEAAGPELSSPQQQNSPG